MIVNDSSMRLYVRFYARIKEEMGREAVNLNVKGSAMNIIDLLRILSKDKKMRKGTLIDYYLQGKLLIAVNEEIIRRNEEGKLILKDGDIIDIMPLPSGG
ncbi:MAG: hypothetical protein DRZ82_09085 [Thermoprotei archaeon]|nr:MAG: hypothetical protein DRZ82_09085 [Thermoprotei archaeon]